MEGKFINNLRYKTLPKRDQLGLLRVEDVVDGKVMEFKCKSVNAMAHYIHKQQAMFEWMCEKSGITVEEGMKLSTSDMVGKYAESASKGEDKA